MATIYDTGKHRWEHDQPIYQNGQPVRWLLGPCPKCGSVTSTYGGGYSCHNDHCPHSADNFACNAGPKPDWWNTDIRVFLDGSAWCATGAGFENLQESPAGFGDSPAAAVADLRHNVEVSRPREASTETSAAVPRSAAPEGYASANNGE